jgi:hypothetical protein
MSTLCPAIVSSLITGASSDDELTAAPRQGDKSAASQDETGQSCTDDGGRDRDTTEGKQLGSELSTHELLAVDVEIRQPAFDSCNQRRLGLLESNYRARVRHEHRASGRGLESE